MDHEAVGNLVVIIFLRKCKEPGACEACKDASKEKIGKHCVGGVRKSIFIRCDEGIPEGRCQGDPIADQEANEIAKQKQLEEDQKMLDAHAKANPEKPKVEPE